MSSPPFMPGMMTPGQAPGGYPGQSPVAPQAAQASFILDIPEDPTWEPIESTDTLAQDGYYCGKIVGEKVRNEEGGKSSIIMTIELIDQDVAGKKIARFMPHPSTTKGDTWFLWRGLMRSVHGTVQAGRSSLRYTPGVFMGQYVYVKTEAYFDKQGSQRTGVASWEIKETWEEAYRTGKHRWTPKPPQATPAVGALPPGLPGSHGGGVPSLPGLPSLPASVPAPSASPMMAAPPVAPPAMMTSPAAPPMQVAPPAPIAAPPAFAPPAGPPSFAAPVPPPVAGTPAGLPPGVPPVTIGPPTVSSPFAPPPGFGVPPVPPAAPVAAAPVPPTPPTNGIPQPPTAASIAGSFPGMQPGK